MARPLRPAAEPNIRIWIITATHLQSAAADQNGGYLRGLYQRDGHAASPFPISELTRG
jgi:hypothetical protein